ncbi:hypothetical protein BH09BAC5_BH09BAC5_20340 [soil metagenome]
MIRPLIIVVNLIIALLFKLFVGVPSAEIKAPASVKAGETFLVEVTISTNGETDFMRYSMDFPEGWKVEKGETSGSSYKYDKQTVKFLWSRIGEVNEVKISYKVTPPENASGDFSMNCKLSHTVDNLPANIQLTPMNIRVDGKENPVSNEKTIPDSTAKPAVVVNIERAVPVDSVNEVFVVSMVVNKDDLKSFGKIEDSLPAGFTAKLIKADGADFKFENGVVKFSWFVLPAKHTLNIQYRVTVAPEVSGNQIISGHFSYVENETGKLIAIEPSVIKIKEKMPVVINTVTEPVENPVVTNNTVENPVIPIETPVETTQKTTENPVVTSPVKTTETPTETKTFQAETTTKIATQKTGNAGVNYTVQIGAFQRMLPTSYFTKTYHLTTTINAEQHNGLNKYTTGNFNAYEAAHNSRNSVQNSGVSDAFVVAYNNGNRITVQEALMITNQKWIQ